MAAERNAMSTVSAAQTKRRHEQGPFYAAVEAAEAFGRRLLVAHGLSEQDATIIAGCLVRADLRGVDTHGLQFLPQYLDRVRRGLVNPKPNLVVERVTPMIGSLDGQNGYGFVVATKAMAAAIEMAKEFGVEYRVGAAQHAFRHGGLLHAAGARGRIDLVRFHQRLARHASLGRTRRFPRH